MLLEISNQLSKIFIQSKVNCSGRFLLTKLSLGCNKQAKYMGEYSTMNIDYDPSSIEQDAQEYWENKQSFRVSEDLNREKFYCLSMFPYPSGQLHMGHVRNYTIGDVISRYQRMLGKNVLQPMGWDAFGLPAENAALKHKLAPSEWTKSNIANMRGQFKTLGFAYDWQREFATCEPEYYRWEQWLFVRLFEKGLVYQKNSVVNWDPVDQTVLANEQVVDGCGWRSGAPVERREISQWFLKITNYADELLEDLQQLEDWPERVRTMQKNWIGRSHGVELEFAVPDHEPLRTFTTRADTLLGATYVAIAAGHPLAKIAAEKSQTVKDFIEKCSHIKVAEAELATLEKEGVDTGIKAIHPITGKEIPIWIANFVVMDYGTGAVMSVPAHDFRDHEFAQKYSLPITPVIKPIDGTDWDYAQGALNDYGVLFNSGQFDGLSSAAACKAIAEYLQKNNQGHKVTNYRLRDWGVSRQRYWGTPIPIIHCEDCGAVPVPENQLPVLLPEGIKLENPGSPLATLEEFYKTQCPKCGKDAKRETDTFDTFVESSWYYARYASYNQAKTMLDDRANYWTPVDQYIGGIEHAVMHLLYARFFHKLLRDEGLVNSDEPFSRLLTQGMVLKDGAKMSKSKGNIVDPQELINKYGADTVRLFIMFASPPEQTLEWSDSGVAGSYRFIKRLYNFAYNNSALKKLNKHINNYGPQPIDWQAAPSELRDYRHKIYEIVKQSRYDYDRLQFNTVVSGSMKLLNILEEFTKAYADELTPEQLSEEKLPNYVGSLLHKGLSILLRLLAPVAPHVTHYLWRELGYGEEIILARWPKVANDALKTDTQKLIVQVNGKLRGEIVIGSDADEQEIQQAALSNTKVKNHIGDKSIRKVISVPGRLVNIVVAN